MIPKKICKKHGELKPDEMYWVKRSRMNKKGELIDYSYYQCNLCREIHTKKYSASEKRECYRKEWEENNKNKRKEYQKKSRAKHRDKLLEDSRRRNKTPKGREIKKKYVKDNAKLLRNEYIKKLICRRSALKGKDVPVKLIEVKRSLLMLKRLIKVKNEYNKNM